MTEHVTVNVAEGTLRGRRVVSQTGSSYCSFQGIPYAAPPVGDLRFKAPQPLAAWSGVLDALKEGNICPQIEPMLNQYTGDEDCLFLNVYTPQLPGNGPNVSTRNAVMVFIHGGGFFHGSGNSNYYGPDYLISQNVIIVTFNYRLGAFGFLSTEDGEIPGNAGMKDQVAALRWVKQNVAQFGGDPNNVTIFGESAGGVSVHYHVLSPMSKGLFQRAISQSGCALNSWAYNEAARSRTVNFARALGCKSDNSKEILSFLKEVSANQLVESLVLGVTDEEKRRGISIPFTPISEGGFSSNEEKFLKGHPLDIIKSGQFNKVEYITGVTTHEGYILLKDIMKHPEILPTIGKDFQRLVPVDMYHQLDTEKSRNAAQKIKEFYFGDKEVNKDTVIEYTELNSDSQFVHKIVESARLHVEHSPTPLYFYQFAFDGRLGLFKRVFGGGHMPEGVCHADDLGYIFYTPLLKEEIPADAPEWKVRDMVVKMWTNFAKTGNPSAEVTWNPVSRDNLCYFRIDQNPEMKTDLEKKQMDFWDELYREAASS